LRPCMVATSMFTRCKVFRQSEGVYINLFPHRFNGALYLGRPVGIIMLGIVSARRDSSPVRPVGTALTACGGTRWDAEVLLWMYAKEPLQLRPF